MDAALQRFCHYGYPKTTMAELAADCRMSPGNLYRYFKGKLDIAAALVREQNRIAAEKLRPVLDCPQRNARQRLIDFLFADLRHTFHLLAHKPRMVEMAQLVAQARPDVQAEMQQREREILAQILRAGAQTGEFRLTDARRTAHCLQSVLMKFRFPQLFTQQKLDELERELSDILAVVLAGLSQPADKALEVLPSAQMDVPMGAKMDAEMGAQMGRANTRMSAEQLRLHAAGG